MDDERQPLRDWHRLFGLLLTDYFTGSPFEVELEKDLSKQQQFLDVLVVRRGRGRFAGRLPDGLEGLVDHNLITFKSHHEALDSWAIKELIGHYVAYRKEHSRPLSKLLPEKQFRLYGICARRPRKLSRQVPWQQRQPGVYDYRWATDMIRVVVAGELARTAHNAPLHLFSASADLVGFGRTAYRRRSEDTSSLLGQLYQTLRGEGVAMAYTMADFRRDYVKKHFLKLTPGEQEEVLRALPPELLRAVLPPEERLAGLPPEQIRQYLEKTPSDVSPKSRKPRRKK
jgi:hypothetical protein